MPTLLSMKIWPKTKMSDVEYFYSAWDSKKLDEMGTSFFFFAHLQALPPTIWEAQKNLKKPWIEEFQAQEFPTDGPTKVTHFEWGQWSSTIISSPYVPTIQQLDCMWIAPKTIAVGAGHKSLEIIQKSMVINAELDHN